MSATLHLSVINDGKSYDWRLFIARAPWTDAKKFHEYMKLVCRQADVEREQMHVPYTLGDLSAAATEVFYYMDRHMKEFTQCNPTHKEHG